MPRVVRIAGAVLLLVGLVMGIVGLFTGCNALFTWNGRHPVSQQAMAPEGQLTKLTLVPEGGVRYTIAIQVAFDREAAERKNAAATVEARMPLVVKVTDGAGTTLAQTLGWIDPSEPPNVLYGGGAKESRRMPELAVERLVGPFTSASIAPLDVTVDLGRDTVGSAVVTERRIAIYDDKTPPHIKAAFALGGVGFAVLLAGAVLSVAGFFRRKKKKRLIRP